MKIGLRPRSAIVIDIELVIKWFRFVGKVTIYLAMAIIKFSAY